MKHVLLIATAEWCYWLRSRLALGAVAIFVVVFTLTSVVTTARMAGEAHQRNHHQNTSEQTFLAQPDRHPHRMVHYGHYLFRAPVPLAAFDPGLDNVTGQAIFLEGHRQNSVMFAESAASADLGGLAWLSPAVVYQVLAPLMLILLGHSAIAREREAGMLTPMLAMGLGGITLMSVKAVALLQFAALLLIPLLLSSAFTIIHGESLAAIGMVAGLYYVYMAVWIGLTLWISSLFTQRATVLAAMVGLWFVLTLVLPSLAVNITANSQQATGKIESDLTMLADVRKVGDGHNANDPAFQQLRAETLQQYGVARIEDLPINFRGMVAMAGEEKLTQVMNNHAEQRMQQETQQAQRLAQFGWLTPAMAISFASRAAAGTDLAHYHRFQTEAETVRYEFVQGLNRAHTEHLSYHHDINRNKDEQSRLRARVDAANWQVIDRYQFHVASVAQRSQQVMPLFFVLLLWLAVVSAGVVFSATRISS